MEQQFSDDEVMVRKTGSAVLSLPKDKIWEVFLRGLDGFSVDFMTEGRDQPELVADVSPRKPLPES